MEAGLSHAPAVQRHCKNSAALSGNYFPGTNRGLPAGGGTFREALRPVLELAGSTFILAVLNTWIRKKQTLLQSGFKDFLNYKISEKQEYISLEKMESVEVKELFIRADNAVSGNISYAARSLGGDRGVDAVGTEAVNLVSGAGKAVVLAAALLWLGIVPALLIMTALVFHVFGGSREKRANYEERVKTTPYRNKNQYVTNVMIDFGFAKEVRLYGLQEFLLGQFRRNKEHFYAARNEAKPAFYFSHILGILGELMQMAATYGYLVLRVYQGCLTLGGFTRYAAVLNDLSQTLVSMVRSYLNFNLYGEYFIDFMKAMEMEEEAEVLETAGTAEDIPEHTICFKEVSFTYPGMNTKALDRVSVEVPLKRSISIVGRNGSGKSTLIKLLLRLYQPDEGRMTKRYGRRLKRQVSGTPSKSFPGSWIPLCSAIIMRMGQICREEKSKSWPLPGCCTRIPPL